MSINKYPYTDFHEMNMDWIIGEVRRLSQIVNNSEIENGRKRYIFIGDSYGHASGTNMGWIDRLIPMMRLSSADYFESAVGGKGFKNNGFLELLQGVSGRIDEPETITDIIVLGGANDIGYSTSQLLSWINDFIDYANSTFENAVVKIGFIAGTTDASVKGIQFGRIIEAYSKAKAVFLDNLQYVFANTSYISADTVHPNMEGYEVLTKHIYGALNGGTSVNYYENTGVGDSIMESVEGSELTTTAGMIMVNNGLTTFVKTNLAEVNFNTPVSITWDSLIPLFKITSKLIFTGSQNAHPFVIPITLACHSTINNVTYNLIGDLILSDNKVYFNCCDYEQLRSTSAMNSIDKIRLPRFTVNFNTLM